jgi:hypothetical protein
MSKRSILRTLCTAVLVSRLGTAQTSAPAASPLDPSAANNAPVFTSPEELKQLRERIAQQEAEIKHLQEAIDHQEKLLERSIAASAKPATPSSATADGTAVVPASASNASNEPVKLIPAVGGTVPVTAASTGPGSHGAGQHNIATPSSSLSVKIGNTTFTPLGFVDATFFGRSTNVGSGIGTNFGSVPYNTSATGHLSEMNFSTQNSRIGFRVDSTVLGAKVLGYFEADFLGNQPATVFVSSNADTFRMRNVFVDVTKNGFEFLGGQDWSMMTPNRVGLSPLPADIFYTQDMDTNYQAGLVWSRQTQFRFIAHPNDNLAFGVSLENPEQYIGGANGAGAATAPAAFSTAASAQFNNGSGTNYTAPNLHPDIVFKGAYDGHVGDKVMHIEAGALVRTFKFANGSGKPVTYNTYSATAASGEVNANLQLFRNFHLIANTFFGSGNGRYIFAQAPDAVIRADGSIAPLHSYSTVDGFEANLSKNTLLYAYYGGIYIDRDQIFDSTATGSTLAKPVYVGYGYKGSSNSQNRTVQEATIGIVRTLWKSTNYGALSLISQYSYLTRNPWYVATGNPKDTHTNMYWLDLRYTLP